MQTDEDLNVAQDEDADFDAGWDEVDAAAPSTTDDDHDEDTDINPDAEDDDAGEDIDNDDEVADDEVVDGITEKELKQELANVQQKLRSAQGRLRSTDKLQTQFEELTRQKDELLALISKGHPVATSKDGDRGATSESGDEEIIPSGYTREEWESYQEDFPVQAKREVEREKEMRALKSETESVKQAADAAAAKAARSEFEKPILEKHPDYHQIEKDPGELLDFIESQSPATKRAYMDVVNMGSQEEVIDLLDQFKASKTTPDDTGTEEDIPAKSGDSSNKAAKAMAVRSQSKSSPNVKKSRVDMDDFDAGWDEANK